MIRTKCIILFGILASLLAPLSVSAETMTLSPAMSAYGVDGGQDYGQTIDGVYDTFYQTQSVHTRRYRSLDFTKFIEMRGAYEFPLPDQLLSPGVVVTSASLKIPKKYSSSGYGDLIHVYSYAGNGSPDLNDFEQVSNLVGSLNPSSSTYALDVTELVQSSLGYQSFLGFNLVVSWWDVFVELGTNASLTIEYASDVVVDAAPQVTISAPMEGSVHYQGVPISFAAEAFDDFDGDLTAELSWYSPYYAQPLGSGGEVQKDMIPGAHTVIAHVTDSVGNQGSSAVSFQVLANDTPALSIASPPEGAVVTEGEALVLNASASDGEDGNLTGSITWASNLDGQLGSGGFLQVSTLSSGQHTLTAIVTDSVGASATSSVSITVVEAISNTPPSLTITSPTPDQIVPSTTLVTLSGTAMDAEDGLLSIAWTSDLQGFIMNATNGVAGLQVGTHVLTAKASDSAGAVVTATVTVHVVSEPSPPPPDEYCSASGNNATYEWISKVSIGSHSRSSGSNNGYADFSYSPMSLASGSTYSIELMPGFSGGSYVEHWRVWLDANQDKVFADSEEIFNASSSTAVSGTFHLPADAIDGVTGLRVAMRYGGSPQQCGSFVYGEVEDYAVEITQAGGPDTPEELEYCTASGSVTNYEWIERVVMNSQVRQSGRNGGYHDHGAASAIPLSLSSLNTFELVPGFSGGPYRENWSVWVDLDQNGQFSSQELVYSGNNTSALHGSLSLPPTALYGETRMRVAMRYGSAPSACGNFTYGEVEDFTVFIVD